MGDLKVDLAQARRFLTALALDEQDTIFCFQVFADKPPGPAAWHITGALDKCAQQLIIANRGGCGVFVTVNQTDGKGREAKNIIRVRAVFADLDGAPLEPVKACVLKPHIIVESSRGRYHAYWKVKDFPLDQFSDCQRSIAARFGSDPKVHDLPRVMRLPGFFHQKNEPFQTRIIDA